MRFKPNMNTIFLLLLSILIFFVIVYILSTHESTKSSIQNDVRAKEKFENSSLLPKDKIVVVQGNSLPDLDKVQPIQFDEHESFPSVDGTKDGPRSLFSLSFNKCSPSCCPSTYSCGGGCVCMTDEQKNFIGSRGFNNKSCKQNVVDTSI